MRWMWIDRIIDFEAETRLVAVKDIAQAKKNQQAHIPAMDDDASMSILPMSLVIEGMAQTAGILVGSVNHFREKVILAKITRAVLEADAAPGHDIRFEATLERIDDKGASTSGSVFRRTGEQEKWEHVGRIDLMFSHIDQNMAGLEFPEENFVFSDNFKAILSSAGLEHLTRQDI